MLYFVNYVSHYVTIGISLTAYREAMRLGSCNYVCHPCRDGEANMLSGAEMPSLEESVSYWNFDAY